MSNLPKFLHTRPLISLAIPGSHDSCANLLFEKSPVANDEGRFIRTIGRLSLIRRLIRRWAITQHYSVNEQLYAGIRYFDMRITQPSCPSLNGIRVLHALYGDELQQILCEMNKFLEKHSREVVILDFNHLYNFSSQSYKEFMKIIESVFSVAKLCPCSDITTISLQDMWENGYQIITISARERHMPTKPWIWGPGVIVSPYANTNRTDQLFKFLDIHLKNHRMLPRNVLYVTQAILTAKMSDICCHPHSSLEDVFARKCTEQAVNWINSFDEPSDFNIIICDFVDLYKFCDTVISINTRQKP